MTKIISINPQPKVQSEMCALLEQNAPVYGIEFTLPALANLLTANIDGQHNATGGKAAIEIALNCAIPPQVATYAIVRPDADALGAVAVLEIRRNLIHEYGDDNIALLLPEMAERITYIAKHDAFQFGAWPGPRDPSTLAKDPSSLLFAALSAICMDFKQSIESRVEKMRTWLETGDCDVLATSRTKIESDNVKALSDAEIVEQAAKYVVLKAHTMGATSIGYCYAPVVVIENDAFTFPGVDGTHTKYTICQFQAGKHANLIAVSDALNKIEKSGGTWGGSLAIVGSPQGVSSTLTMEQVLSSVRANLIIK